MCENGLRTLPDREDGMSHQGHRRRSKRTVGWQQRQNWHTKTVRQEHGNTVIDRALGRQWPTHHGELLRTAHRLSNAHEIFYVWHKPGGSWQMGSYTIR